MSSLDFCFVPLHTMQSNLGNCSSVAPFSPCIFRDCIAEAISEWNRVLTAFLPKILCRHPLLHPPVTAPKQITRPKDKVLCYRSTPRPHRECLRLTVTCCRGTNLKTISEVLKEEVPVSFTHKAKSPIAQARKRGSVLCARTAVSSGTYGMAMREFVSLVHVVENGHRGS